MSVASRPVRRGHQKSDRAPSVLFSSPFRELIEATWPMSPAEWTSTFGRLAASGATSICHVWQMLRNEFLRLILDRIGAVGCLQKR
jgi:hypothetical protein